MSDRLEQLVKLHTSDPADPFCTYGIALEHAKADRADQAIHWLDETLRLDSSYCYAYYQKARVLSEAGRSQEARQVVGAGLAAAKKAGDQHASEELAQLLDTLD